MIPKNTPEITDNHRKRSQKHGNSYIGGEHDGACEGNITDCEYDSADRDGEV